MKGTGVGETRPIVCQVMLTIAALVACIRILALNGANIFEVGRLVCESSCALFRRFATAFSSSPVSNPRYILQLHMYLHHKRWRQQIVKEKLCISPMMKDFSDLMQADVFSIMYINMWGKIHMDAARGVIFTFYTLAFRNWECDRALI